MSSPSCPRCSAPVPADAPGGLCPQCLLQAGFESGPVDSAAAATAANTAQAFAAPSVTMLSRYFPQLEILELLGTGGMGAVYKARQKGLDRLVALKILPPHLGRDSSFVERFQREARALARLNHKNIVAVYDFGQVQDLCYLTMEYIDGPNLRRTIASGKLAPHEALAIVPQICEALQYAHDAGIVHRDIKPENILLDAQGRVKVADFGLAKLVDDDRPGAALTATEQVMGTLRYMAPEQMQGTKAVDHRADIFSLGVVFYELLTGELPVGRFVPPSQKVQIDVRLDDVVLRTLEQEPAKRYQRAADVLNDVASVVSQPNAAPPAGTVPRAPETPSNPPTDVASLACAILAVLFFALGMTVPAVLFAIPNVQWVVPIGLFYGLMILTFVMGLVGRAYAFGWYVAIVALLLMVLPPSVWVVLPIGGAPPAQSDALVEYGDPERRIAGRPLASIDEQSTTPEPSGADAGSLDASRRETLLVGDWTESNAPALRPAHTFKFLATGEWHEGGPLRFSMGNGPTITAAEDLDGDGKKEILPFHSSGVWTLEGDTLVLEAAKSNLPDAKLRPRRLQIEELTAERLVLKVLTDGQPSERWIFFRAAGPLAAPPAP